MSMDEARKPENLPKNRYRDILPCKLFVRGYLQYQRPLNKEFYLILNSNNVIDDDTRVKLIKGNSDYINANYVNVSNYIIEFVIL